MTELKNIVQTEFPSYLVDGGQTVSSADLKRRFFCGRTVPKLLQQGNMRVFFYLDSGLTFHAYYQLYD